MLQHGSSVRTRRASTPAVAHTLQVGDTVGALFHLLPGLDIFCASRVIDWFDPLIILLFIFDMVVKPFG